MNRIMVVDDESVAVNVQHMLESFGYDVTAVVTSGEKAIEQAAETHPDLVLMEIVLGGTMDGIEAAKQIRARFDIPVVYLTAYANDDTLQRAKMIEPYGYIIKPFEERDLHTAIEIALYKHEMERELHETEKYYHLLAENVTDVIWTMYLNLRFTYITPSIMHLTGHSVEEVMSLTLEELLTPASYELAMKTLAEELTMEQSEQKDLLRTRMLELELTRKDGSTVWTETKMTFLRDQNGQPVGILGVTRDITERKQAEEALLESQAKYKALFDCTLYGLYVHDFEGRFIDANTAALNMLGYTKEDLRSFTISSLIAEDQLPMVRERIEEIKETGFQRTPTQFKVKKKDGNYIWVEIDASAIYREGKPSAIQGIVRDITERKRMEEQAKTSLGEKEVLLKEIHHRIKNNLQIISSLLDMHSLRTSDPQTIDLLKEARAKIQAMALIHSQLYQSNQLARVDMKRYIQELVDHLSHVYANRKNSITYDLEHSDIYLPISQAIPCALVLHEVGSNAFKHAFKERQKGVIKISMQKSGNDKILTKVEDDGIGIPEEINIYKTDSMGLKLVRNLVQEQLKGNIRIIRDNGTKVFIEFKVLKEEPEDA